MIVRMWRGTTRRDDADAYTTYVSRTGMPGYAATPGCLGAELLVQLHEELAEFLVVSRWASMDAVRSFAGDTPYRAVFYPEDRRYLVTFDEDVSHWECVDLGVFMSAPEG